MSEQKFNELRKLAEQARDEAIKYDELASEARKRATDYEAQAVELAAPFKRGDVIEYEKKVGWRDGGKVKTFRLRVDRLSIDWHGDVNVTGRQVTAKGELGSHTAYVTLGRKEAKFIRVVKSA